MFTAFSRTIILYFVIIVGIRLMGKRQVGELEPSELVLSLLIADLASVPMQDPALPLHTGIIPILTLLSLSMILSILTMHSVRFRVMLCGRPSVVIRSGKINQEAMRQTRLTIDELLEELRTQGYTDLSSIQYAILETNGMMSVLPYSAHKPPTQQMMALSESDRGLPIIIISDGELLERNLSMCGYDYTWLTHHMEKNDCAKYGDVYLLTVDEVGGVYCLKRSTAR